MPYNVVKDRKYLKDHDWAKEEDGQVLIGVTDFAQQTLKDIVYVELPEVGETVEVGEIFGSIESVKAVSDEIAACSAPVTYPSRIRISEALSRASRMGYCRTSLTETCSIAPSTAISGISPNADSCRFESLRSSLPVRQSG